jgi:hypothetical protein
VPFSVEDRKTYHSSLSLMASSSVSSIPFEGLLLPLPLIGEEEACDMALMHAIPCFQLPYREPERGG